MMIDGSRTFFQDLQIANPKQYAERLPQSERLFPYYAGYSQTFAANLLASVRAEPTAVVLDPWNGSGTTTRAAHHAGLNAVGFDLNPVMVLVGKAAMLSARERPSLVPLAKRLLDRVKRRAIRDGSADPLCRWLVPTSAGVVRAIENEINRTFVSHNKYVTLQDASSVSGVSDLAAFFYVALFRTTRQILKEFIPTNPTWVKSPMTTRHRKRPALGFLLEIFMQQIESLSNALCSTGISCAKETSQSSIIQATSEDLPLDDGTIDIVITSPPYCTRLDYAVATAVELAVLGFEKSAFDSIRRSLMGTSTVSDSIETVRPQWGTTCAEFLDRLGAHPSKASSTYYLRNHLQYFSSLSSSLREIRRVLKGDGLCFIVVQDSYYKELRNDVPKIAAEMAEREGLRLSRSQEFSASKSMVGMNSRARVHLSQRTNIESVLCFQAT